MSASFPPPDSSPTKTGFAAWVSTHKGWSIAIGVTILLGIRVANSGDSTPEVQSAAPTQVVTPTETVPPSQQPPTEVQVPDLVGLDVSAAAPELDGVSVVRLPTPCGRWRPGGPSGPGRYRTRGAHLRRAS